MRLIFLDADIGRLKSRWGSRGSWHRTPEYPHMQRTTLLSLSKKLSSHRLLYVNTGKQTVKETHKLIIEHLMKFW